MVNVTSFVEWNVQFALDDASARLNYMHMLICISAYELGAASIARLMLT
jgi:hypothetical protein